MSYSIAFFADPHAGYSYGSRTDEQGVNLRVRDGYNALHEIFNDIIAHKDKVDVVALGGDLFHTSQPTVRTIAIVQHYLRALSEVGLDIHILAGNHDATDDRSYPAAVAVVDDPGRGIYAHYRPYDIAHLADGINLHCLSHHGLHHDDEPELTPTPGDVNVLMTHGAAVDPANSTLMRCMDSPREQIISPEVVLNEDFTLRMLGHYHSRHAVGGEEMNTWYAGSTVRRGFSDAPGPRGWTLFTIHDTGIVEVEHHDIFQRPQFDLPVIDAAQLSGADVEELVLENLATTREGSVGDPFDLLRGPIVRQRVINAGRTIREGIDRKYIFSQADHALKWDLDLKRPEVAEVDATISPSAAASPSISRSSALNVVSSYEAWKDTSPTLNNLPEEYVEPVSNRVEEHLTEAQNRALSS